MTDLFPDLPPSLSPFCAWKKRHDIRTEPVEVWVGGTRFPDKWRACSPDKTTAVFEGPTEEEACWSLALACGLEHWGLE